ncbi:MAG: transaldolase [Chloroflexi bacterium]|nr:transaldolase [Chloroflexota bacterium]
MTRAVFFDRDGVLNRAIVREGKPHPPANLDQLEIPGDARDALRALRAAGFLLIGVTNQPDVARGTQTRAMVEAINAALRARLPLDEIRVCYHDDADACECRKPAPGLLVQAAREYNIDLAASFMIGDRWKDVQAGRRAGCRTIHLDGRYAETWRGASADVRVQSLRDAAEWIIMTSGGNIGMKAISDLRVKIFADGADKAGMLEMYRQPFIKGFTTNPTLMRKAGIADYTAFARDMLQAIPDRPISFEVFSDEFAEMERQARLIAQWGANVYVKIPVTNTRRESAIPLIRRLADAGIQLNVTAMMTLAQVRDVSAALAGGAPSCVSVFAGRIADTGRDPVPMMAAAVELIRPYPNVELIWASPRELLNVFHADAIGCHIITVTNDILKKLNLVGKDLDEYSLDTVKMFYDDAAKVGYSL